MAWASRSKRDQKALDDYVQRYSTVLDAWRSVPGLDIQIDHGRADAASAKSERHAVAATGDAPQNGKEDSGAPEVG